MTADDESSSRTNEASPPENSPAGAESPAAAEPTAAAEGPAASEAPSTPASGTGDPSAAEGSGETIKLDQFLKLANLVGSGGEAKMLIRSGAVQVNGDEETRRGRKLRHGDVVNFNGEDYVIETTSD